MTVTTIERLSEHAGETVTLQGWIYNRRSSGKIHFLMIRDGTGICQCVAGKQDVSEDDFERCRQLTQESSVRVTGHVREEKRAPGGYEMTVSGVEVVHIAQEYPITPKEHGTAFLMDHRHLWLRSQRQHAAIRVRATVIRAIRDFFDQRGFLLLDTPILTPAACEGTTTLFETDYFEEQKAYLSQSGQLYAEAGAMAFGKVYCFGPTFRAEKSKTRRHLTEFWMVEPEMAFAGLDDVMDLGEDLIVAIVQRVLEERRLELEVLERDTAPLEAIRKPFPRRSYTEILGELKTKGIEVPWGEDFGGDEETVIAEGYDCPVMIHRYPKTCKAFYMKPDPADPRVALCVDVIAPEGYGEIIGGAQREDDYEALAQRIDEHQLPRAAFEWYLDLRKYGSVPHGGFGLGVERTVAWMCGLKHVRETIPFPRLLQRLYP